MSLKQATGLDFIINPYSSEDPLSFRQHFVMFLVTNSYLRIVNNIYFNFDAAEKLYQKRFGFNDQPLQDYIDCIKELSNITAGKTKHFFEEFGIQLEHSLPIQMAPYNEIYVLEYYQNFETQYVTLEVDGINLLCSTFVHVAQEHQTQVDKFEKEFDLSLAEKEIYEIEVF